MEKSFKIIGLDCDNCAVQLENSIKKIEGIESASVSFITEKLVIKANKNSIEEIIK